MSSNNNKFVITDLYLERSLFNKDRAKNGPRTYLNINCIPNFFVYLKTKLTEQQKKSVK